MEDCYPYGEAVAWIVEFASALRRRDQVRAAYCRDRLLRLRVRVSFGAKKAAGR